MMFDFTVKHFRGLCILTIVSGIIGIGALLLSTVSDAAILLWLSMFLLVGLISGYLVAAVGLSPHPDNPLSNENPSSSKGANK